MSIVYVPTQQQDDTSIVRNLAGAAQAGQGLSQQGLKKTQMMWDMRTGDPNTDNAVMSRLGYDYFDRGDPAAPSGTYVGGGAGSPSLLQGMAPGGPPDRSQAATLAVDPRTGKQIVDQVETVGEQQYRDLAKKEGLRRNTKEDRMAIRERQMGIDITKPEEDQVLDYAIKNGLITPKESEGIYKSHTEGSMAGAVERIGTTPAELQSKKNWNQIYREAKRLMKQDETDLLKIEKIERKQAEADMKKQALQESNQRRSIVAAGRPENFKSRDRGGQFLELNEMATQDIMAGKTYQEKMRAYNRYVTGFDNLKSHWRDERKSPRSPEDMGIFPPSKGGGGPGKTDEFRYFTGQYNDDGSPKYITGRIPQAYMGSKEKQANYLARNFGVTNFNESNIRFESPNARESQVKFDEELRLAKKAEAEREADEYSSIFSFESTEDENYNRDMEKKDAPYRRYKGRVVTLQDYKALTRQSGGQSAPSGPSPSATASAKSGGGKNAVMARHGMIK